MLCKNAWVFLHGLPGFEKKPPKRAIQATWAYVHYQNMLVNADVI
jgi:hypothetical protein